MGISYSPMQSGAFVLLLAQVDGPYRIPMVIGAAEAQSIAIRLEGIVTPRPITHDLFCSMAHAFRLELSEVLIYKFENSIFYSELLFTDGELKVNLEARTSDAIAIALRMGAPIYTTREILHLTGTILEESKSTDPDYSTPESDDDEGRDTIEKLQQRLERLIAEENYEEAAKISEKIKNLKR